MRRTNFGISRVAAAATLLAACFPAGSLAQQQGQKTFSSPQDASTALAAPAQSNDERAMLEIPGPDGKQIASVQSNRLSGSCGRICFANGASNSLPISCLFCAPKSGSEGQLETYHGIRQEFE